MDDNSDKPQALERSHRASLVERAAERIATGRGVASKAPPAPAPVAAPVAPSPAAAEAGEVAEPLNRPAGGETHDAAPRLVEEAIRDANLAMESEPASEAQPPSARGTKRSRVAKIDIARLMSRNILTPETKRNRTVEEFRLIKRMVLSRRWDEGDAPGNTIIVTSALPSEGKTTTAINLAMSIAAEEDLRVVLVDADFVKPDALRQLGVSANKGLVDVLQDPRMDISDVMLRTDIEKLSLIPSGRLHDRCTELLASARMDELITELAGRYEDRILIFDSPPMLVTTESVTLASHMGQVLFVVQAGRTKRESVDSALELIGDRPRLGLVLNRTSVRFGNTEFGSYYGSYYYGYDKAEKE